MARRVVVATGNAGKVRELSAALAPLDHVLVAQGDLGIASAPETGATFVENAIAKARHAAEQSGLAAIADDSGLVVPALGGEPGLYSARYAGCGASDRDNNAKLIARLAGRGRAAYFTCVLVFLRSAADPAPHIAAGRWHGVLVDEPRGANGFGYDPHFLLPALGRTAAELSTAEKNALSHRGQACRALAALLAQERAQAP